MTGKIAIHILTILAIILAAASTTSGNTYVDWEGEYYIEYPDDWTEIPYKRVVSFLLSQKVNPDNFTYRLAVSEKAEEPVFGGVYMFISTYEVGKFTDRQIDSTLAAIDEANGIKHITTSLAETTRRFSSRQPVYDESQKAVVIYDKIADAVTNNVLLEMRKFYDNGIVVFFCYAPSDRFESVRPRFLTILNSFSTENLDQFAKSSGEVNIVNVNNRTAADISGSNSETDSADAPRNDLLETILIVLLAVIVLFGICYVITRKKKK